jgi:hypothetical protein
MTIEQKIEELYNYSLEILNEHKIIDIGFVDDKLGERILKETGLDICGFVISMDNYGILHSLQMLRISKSGLFINRRQMPL